MLSRSTRTLIPKLSKLYSSYLIVLCYIINRTDISIFFYIVFDAFCHHSINEYGMVWWCVVTSLIIIIIRQLIRRRNMSMSVGRRLVVTRVHCGQTVHPRPIVTTEH